MFVNAHADADETSYPPTHLLLSSILYLLSSVFLHLCRHSTLISTLPHFHCQFLIFIMDLLSIFPSSCSCSCSCSFVVVIRYSSSIPPLSLILSPIYSRIPVLISRITYHTSRHELRQYSIPSIHPVIHLIPSHPIAPPRPLQSSNHSLSLSRRPQVSRPPRLHITQVTTLPQRV